MRSVLTIICLVATMLGAPAVAQQACPILVVATNDDAVNGDTSSPCALIANPGPDGISLREALLAANNATGSGTITVTFASALAGQTIAPSSANGCCYIVSRDSVAVIGLIGPDGQPAVTVDATNMFILFSVTASNFTLQSLRIIGMGAASPGAKTGVYVRAGDNGGELQVGNTVIEGNVFSDNPGQASGIAVVVGIAFPNAAANAVFSNAVIANNTFTNFTNVSSGGTDAVKLQAEGTNGTVQNVSILHNTFTTVTYPIELVPAFSSGGRILNTHIAANSFSASQTPVIIDPSGDDGQPSTGNTVDGTVIERNALTGNTGPGIMLIGGIGNGSTVSATGNAITNTTIVNNLIAGDATYGGISIAGGRQFSSQNTVRGVNIVNNTIANYTGCNSCGGAIAVDNNLNGGTNNTVSGVAVLNTILWNNTPLDFSGVSASQVTTSITAQAGFAGVNGNINANPQFVSANSDFQLQSGSPARHAGTVAGAPAVDLDCQPRGSQPSIGAYEFDGPNICPSTYSVPLTATPTSGTPPLVVNFMASGLSLPVTYTVNFGDGTTGALAQSSCIGVTAIAGGQGGIQCSGSASHTYTAAGSYTATLLNALGLTVGTLEIFVTGAAPNISVAAPHKATTVGSQTILGSQTIPAMQDAMQDVPRQTLEIPFAGSNATIPTISSFTASPASIAPFAGDGSVTLSWSVVSATSLSISGVGTVTGNSIQVSPSQTTTYTLTASNARGAATAQATVTLARCEKCER
jgi:hypothetical protein